MIILSTCIHPQVSCFVPGPQLLRKHIPRSSDVISSKQFRMSQDIPTAAAEEAKDTLKRLLIETKGSTEAPGVKEAIQVS